MDKVLIVAGNILRRIFRKPSNFLVHLVLPVAVSVVMFMLFSASGSGKIAIAIVDHDASVVSEAVLNQLRETGKFRLVEAVEDQVGKMIADGDVSLAIIIPDDFEPTILEGEMPTLDMMSIGDNEGTAWVNSIVTYQIENIVDMAYAASYDAQTLYTMIDNVQTGRIQVLAEFVEDITNDKSVTVTAIGMYIMVLMMSTCVTSFQLLDEKRMGTFARIGMAPVPAKTYTLANVLANLAIVVVQLIVLILVIEYVIQVETFIHPLALFTVMVCFSLVGISLGLMMAAFSKNMEQTSAMLSLVLTPTCMLAGCFWPVEMMPEYLRKLAYITPQRWTLDALIKLQSSDGFAAAIPELAIVLGFAAVFFLITALVFKHKERRIA